jgi:hypothetical protein
MGTEYSDSLRPGLARSSSADAHRRFSMSWMSMVLVVIGVLLDCSRGYQGWGMGDKLCMSSGADCVYIGVVFMKAIEKGTGGRHGTSPPTQPEVKVLRDPWE